MRKQVVRTVSSTMFDLLIRSNIDCTDFSRLAFDEGDRTLVIARECRSNELLETVMF